MWLNSNRKRFPNRKTNTMIFKPVFMGSFLRKYMSLQPGDVISTGTPASVGLGKKPPLYLNVGDSMSLGIDGLGKQEQSVVAAS